MALYGERKAFYDTKTTCFAVVEAVAYRSCLMSLLLFAPFIAFLKVAKTAGVVEAADFFA